MRDITITASDAMFIAEMLEMVDPMQLDIAEYSRKYRLVKNLKTVAENAFNSDL